ncbi:recombinase family protein [Shinella zoogloeoides]|uniref:recombinase family protein n=1 Tax=Shinella zoogloeoides TaxID=352475 RepID=UPI001F565AC3|nr:recombinase family protein [Shinella zoogloeoides]
MSTIFYARVSTADQTVELQEQQARKAGYNIDLVIADRGQSGLSTKLIDRPEGKRLFDLLRHGDILIVRWVDRLGRNYRDVCDTIQEFMRRGVIIKTVINSMTFDGSTTDPIQQAVRDALIGFMAATAQAQAEATKEAQKAGIEHAKASSEKYKGRKPRFSAEQYQLVLDMLAQGSGATEIYKATKVTRQTVLRIKNDPIAAAKMLARWN